VLELSVGGDPVTMRSALAVFPSPCGLLVPFLQYASLRTCMHILDTPPFFQRWSREPLFEFLSGISHRRS
jgi:hypothetical protein